MINIAYFDKANGHVLRVCQSSRIDSFHSPSSEERAVFVSSMPSGAHVWYDGVNFLASPDAPSSFYSWDFEGKKWFFGEDERRNAVQECSYQIDEIAGAVRLRYITSVPGQAETYQRKEQQAREWMAQNFAGSPPSFIAAEAQALGQPPEDVAIGIVATADQWANVKGPAIEAARRAGKVAVAAATTIEQIEQARDAAIAALEAL